ncbi:MAG: hypothetical protein WBC44_18565, partial [Planctomycetaceae bacterium]
DRMKPAMSLRPLPAKSRIRVIEVSDDRLVLAIGAAGWRAWPIILFAALWNLGNGIFVTAEILGRLGPMPLLIRLGMFAMSFVAIGLAAEAIRETFARILILVEADRIVVRRHLFGVGTTRTVALGPASRAEIEPGNSRPAPRVVIVGEQETATIESALSAEDASWLVEVLASFRRDGGERVVKRAP